MHKAMVHGWGHHAGLSAHPAASPAGTVHPATRLPLRAPPWCPDRCYELQWPCSVLSEREKRGHGRTGACTRRPHGARTPLHGLGTHNICKLVPYGVCTASPPVHCRHRRHCCLWLLLLLLLLCSIYTTRVRLP